MFWNRKHRESAPTSLPATDQAPDSGALTGALDTVALLLKAFGEHAFDTAEVAATEVRAQCDALAAAVLQQREEQSGGAAQKHGDCRRFFTQHRAHEAEWVQHTVTDLREALRDFATCLASSVQEDRRTDDKLGVQLGRLMGACSSSDPARIRSEAQALSELVQGQLKRRREREQQQIKALGDRVRQLRQELREAREQAAVDGLTQVFNRAAFDGELARLTALGVMLGTEPCLLMVDVDHFKSVNDRFGHTTGDTVLRGVADSLVRTFLRREDFVARYGGEEFAVVLPDSELKGVKERAERLRKAVREQKFRHLDQEFQVTVSIGVAELRTGESPTEWLERADQALYAAKRQGRDRVIIAGDAVLEPRPPAEAAPAGGSLRSGAKRQSKSATTG